MVDKDSKINSSTSVQQGIYKTEARKLLDHIQEKNEEDKAISLVLELAVGKVPETIQRMVRIACFSRPEISYAKLQILQIKIYAPACLIVGTRGRSLGGIQGLLPGSVSKYCLQNSPVPVIVVRPEEKRDKKKQKRLANPSRQTYSSILGQTTASGSGAFDTLAGDSDGDASENEAAAVAKAIGLRKGLGAWQGFKKENEDGTALAKVATGKSDATSEAESPSPTGPLVMDEDIEDVPDLDELSGTLSDAGEEADEVDEREGDEDMVT